MGAVEDKLEIVELMVRSVYCADCGDAAGFADTFADDGSAQFFTVGTRRPCKAARRS